MNISLRKPTSYDLLELENLFKITIGNAFRQEGIVGGDEVHSEVKNQLDLVNQEFSGSSSAVFFLIAENEKRIVGTGAFCPANSIIQKYMTFDFEKASEIASMYVLPDHQGQGIGTILLKGILSALKSRNISKYCLDCGYRNSQQFWSRRLGEPPVILPAYWGSGSDHMIWYGSVDDVRAE